MIYLLKTLFFIDVLMAAGLLLFRWALLPNRRELVSGKLAALALFTPAMALFCGNVYLFFAYLAVVTAFNSRSRVELAGAYVFLLPLMPILVVETRVGSVYLFGLSVVAAMGFGTLVGFAITSSRRTPVLLRYDLAMWVIVGIFVLIYNRDFNPTGLLRGLVTNLLTFAAPYFLVSRAARREVDIDRLFLRLCLGATVMAVTALFQARRHWVMFEVYYQALHAQQLLGSASIAMRAGFLRTGGSMVDYSAGGLFLAAMVTLLPLLKRHFHPLGFWTVLAVLTGGLFVTQSRGAWVAAIVGLVFVAAYRGQWGKVLLVAGGGGVAELTLLSSGKAGKLAEILGQTGDAAGTIDYRHRLASQGIDQVQAHPWFGQSPDRLVSNLSELTQGQHIVDFVNSHLFIAMAGGVPAFLLWCWVWLMPVIQGWRYREGGATLGVMPAAIIVPAMVAMIFTSIGDRNLTWATIALALAPACFAFSRRPRGVSKARDRKQSSIVSIGWRPSAQLLPRAEPS